MPFTGYGYTLNATFSNGVNISTNSPVRIAGVDVGEVISAPAATATRPRSPSRSTASGRPVHEDAYAEIKPRIFLEGNFFIDLDRAARARRNSDSGGTIPVSRTSTAVQLDQIFTALQSPVRADLSRLLESYGEALTHKPTRGRRRHPAARGERQDRRRRPQRGAASTAARPAATAPRSPTPSSAPARATCRGWSPARAAPSAPSPVARPTCRG